MIEQLEIFRVRFWYVVNIVRVVHPDVQCLWGVVGFTISTRTSRGLTLMNEISEKY